jgi:hypothetical protein
MDEHLAWAVETSRDGQKWRYLGKGWTNPGEPLLLHGALTFVRFKPADDKEFGEALERTGDEPMTLIDLDRGTRRDLWPSPEHHGLPVLLPGGEVGRLLRFERDAQGDEFTWALEFRGERYRGP